MLLLLFYLMRSMIHDEILILFSLIRIMVHHDILLFIIISSY